MAFVARCVVCDVNLSTVVNPKASHNDVVHSERNLGPGVVVASLPEHQMAHTNHLNLEVASTEFRRHGEIEPSVPLVALTVEGRDGRVVAHLGEVKKWDNVKTVTGLIQIEFHCQRTCSATARQPRSSVRSHS